MSRHESNCERQSTRRRIKETVFCLLVLGTVSMNVCAAEGPGAPVLLGAPTNQTLNAGESLELFIEASGAPTLWYRLLYEGTNNVSSGFSFPFLYISEALGKDSGRYLVIVSNDFGSVTSAVFTVNVIDPAFAVQPLFYTSMGAATNTATVQAGRPVQIQARVAGTAPLGIQWYRNGVLLNGSTQESLAIPRVRSSDAGNYTAVASNSFGWGTSLVATLSVPPHTIEMFQVGAWPNEIGQGSFQSAHSVALSGRVALVGSAGLDIIEVADPLHPVWRGHYDYNSSALAVAPDYVLLAADGRTNALVLNIHNPEVPGPFGVCELNGYFSGGLAATDDYALVTSWRDADRLQVFDMANDHGFPRLLGCVSNVAGALVISGHHAYVANPSAGLQIIDLNRLDEPSIVATSNTMGIAREIAIQDNYVYVTSYRCKTGRPIWCSFNAWLEIFDVSEPASARRLASHRIGQDCGLSTELAGFAVSGRYAFIGWHCVDPSMGGGGSSVDVIDVANPASPVLIQTFDVKEWVTDVAAAGNYVYVTTAEVGLQVLQLAPSLSVSLVKDALNIQVLGDIGRPYALESSSSLGGWQSLATITLTNLQQTISITPGNQTLQSFYRLRALP